MPPISGTNEPVNAIPQKGDGSVTQVSSDSSGGNSGNSGFSTLVDSLSEPMGASGVSSISQKSADAGNEPKPLKVSKDCKAGDGKSGTPGVTPQTNGMAVTLPHAAGTAPAKTEDGKSGTPGVTPQANGMGTTIPSAAGTAPAETEDGKSGSAGVTPQTNGMGATIPSAAGTAPAETEGGKSGSAGVTPQMNGIAVTIPHAAEDADEVNNSASIDQTSVSQDKQNLQQLIQEFGKLQSGDSGTVLPMSSHDSQDITDTAGGEDAKSPQKGDGNDTKDIKSLPEFDSLLSLKSLSGKGQSLQTGASATGNSQNADETKTTAHDNEGSSSNSPEPLNSQIMGFSGMVRPENAAVPNAQSGPSEATTVKPSVTDMTDGKVYIMKDSNNLAVTLEPDGLGKLNIQLSLDKGMITTQISVPDNAVKNLIENNIQHIVNSLINEGLSVGGFSVSLRDGQGTEKNESQYQVSRSGNVSDTPEITASVYDRNSEAGNGHVNMYI
ncbi:MAG: flagellar hook-length control protein FliK [Thermodesulfovibrionales bacterium]